MAGDAAHLELDEALAHVGVEDLAQLAHEHLVGSLALEELIEVVVEALEDLADIASCAVVPKTERHSWPNVKFVSVPSEEVRYRMRDDEPPFLESTVTFQVLPNAVGGTRLRVIHAPADARAQRQLPRAANSNWRCLMRAA